MATGEIKHQISGKCMHESCNLHESALERDRKSFLFFRTSSPKYKIEILLLHTALRTFLETSPNRFLNRFESAFYESSEKNLLKNRFFSYNQFRVLNRDSENVRLSLQVNRFLKLLVNLFTASQCTKLKVAFH